MKELVLEIADLVGGNLLTQCLAAFEPSGDGLKPFPTAIAVSFQVHSTAQRRTGVAVGKYGFAARGALELEEFGMGDCGLDERTQPHRVLSQLRNDAVDAVGHLHVQGDEIKAVVVLPVIEMPIDFVGIGIEGLGEKTLLLGRAQCVLLEEVVFVHDTDFF